MLPSIKNKRLKCGMVVEGDLCEGPGKNTTQKCGATQYNEPNLGFSQEVGRSGKANRILGRGVNRDISCGGGDEDPNREVGWVLATITTWILKCQMHPGPPQRQDE